MEKIVEKHPVKYGFNSYTYDMNNTNEIRNYSGVTQVTATFVPVSDFPELPGTRIERWVGALGTAPVLTVCVEAGRTSDGRIVPVTRRIVYKANPKRHECDARCRNAKGNSCECECGGQFHGAGAWND